MNPEHHDWILDRDFWICIKCGLNIRALFGTKDTMIRNRPAPDHGKDRGCSCDMIIVQKVHND